MALHLAYWELARKSGSQNNVLMSRISGIRIIVVDDLEA